MSASRAQRFPRRWLLATATAGAAGLVGGCSSASPRPAASAAGSPREGGGRVDPHGDHQAGVASPAVAQQHCQLSVWRLSTGDGSAGRDRLAGLLAAMGAKISALASGADDAVQGVVPADLTVTVGLGPAVVASVDPALPGAAALPEFARERIDPTHRGGDLMIQTCAADQPLLSAAAGELERLLRPAAEPLWSQNGFRGSPLPDNGAARNLLGFVDGIVGPHQPGELDENVWLGTEAGRLRGGTVAVVRRMVLDLDAFLALPVEQQERIIGRRKSDGLPLSGGDDPTTVDLGAKTPDGQYVIPVDAHVRRAHPLATGVGMMLRRAYSFDDGPGARGLLFISFQRELRTFTATQQRLDESDALMRFATTTASGTFLVLPGFGPGRDLGATLLR